MKYPHSICPLLLLAIFTSVPARAFTQQELNAFSEHAVDFKNAADARQLQSTEALKALSDPGNCGDGKTHADCLKEEISLMKARANLMSDEEAKKAEEQIADLQIQLDSPELLANTAAYLSDASSALGIVADNQDLSTTTEPSALDAQDPHFSYREHMKIILNSFAGSWKELGTPGPMIALTGGLFGYAFSRGTSLNEQAKDHFNEHPTPGALNFIGNQTGYGYPVIAPFLVVAAITKNNDTMETFDELAVGTALSQIFVEAGKYAIHEERPNRLDNLGFPSGHSTQSFMMATILDHRYGHKVGIPAFFAAAGVGLIRIGQNMHSPGEVAFGAGLGVATGIAAYTAVEAETSKIKSKKLAFLAQAATGNVKIKGTEFHCIPMGFPGGMGGGCQIFRSR